jgi:hypothetical protein
MSEIPEHISRLKDVMSGFSETWSLCGGWAVDALIGEETRRHDDIDILIFEDAQPAFFQHMQGWDMVAHDETVWDGTDERWNGRPLTLPAHVHIPAVFHYEESGAISSKDGFAIDLQVNEATDGEWVITRNEVTVPLDKAFYQSEWGLPTVVPEVLLLYKAIERRRRDERDFQALLPRLNDTQRTWLHDAIARLRHPWLAKLAAEAGVS